MDQIDSEVVRGLAERAAEGKISVRAVAEFGANLTKDGCPKACQWLCARSDFKCVTIRSTLFLAY